MYPPNEELQRYPRHGTDPYNSPVTSTSGRGGLITMLVIVVFVGSLIAYSSLSGPPADAPPAVDTEAPESITGSGATEIN
ncbi:hypothetical protein V8359_00500 [Roseovarius sp. E0-M6]